MTTTAPSPPTQLDAWDLTADFQKIVQQWDALIALCSNSDSFAARAPEVSDWSIGKQVAHVAITAEYIANSIDRLIAEPEHNAGETPKEIAHTVMSAGRIPRGVGKAPAVLDVTDEPDPGEMLAELHRAKEHWNHLTAKAKTLTDGTARAPHFAFGYLDASEWVRFTALHTAHHLKIVRDILLEANRDVPFDYHLDDTNA